MNKKFTSIQYNNTDTEKLKAMSDEQINFSDIPKITSEMFSKPVVRKNFNSVSKKAIINIEIDKDVEEFFKNDVNNYQTTINKLLRSYMETSQKSL